MNIFSISTITVIVVLLVQQSSFGSMSKEEFMHLSIDVVMHKERKDTELEGSLHNGYAGLIEYGKKESVPFLIDDLTEANEAIRKAEEKDEGYICTWKHLHDALKAQTGEDFGYDQKAWRNWWDTTGKNLPEEHFDPAKNKKEVNKAVDAMPTNARLFHITPRDFNDSRPGYQPEVGIASL